MPTQMLLLTTPEGCKIAIDASQIESIVEQKKYTTGHYDSNSVWVDGAPVGCEINMRSGDKGKVRETFDVVTGLLAGLGAGE